MDNDGVLGSFDLPGVTTPQAPDTPYLLPTDYKCVRKTNRLSERGTGAMPSINRFSLSRKPIRTFEDVMNESLWWFCVVVVVIENRR